MFSRQALAKNSLINFIGFVLPLAVGLISIPLIVRGFGVDRFGLLTLAWAIIGYFTLFDLGIGRAITQLTAERLSDSSPKDVSRLVWTGLSMMAVFAAGGALIAAGLAPWLVSAVLKMPEALKEEAIWAFLALAAAIPAVVLSAGFAGALAALQRFDIINALRIPMGMAIFLIPLAVMPFSQNMAYVCLGLAVVRAIFLVLHMAACFHAFPALRSHFGIQRADIGKLLRFGGWMTVTNIVGPLMVYMDRFIIGATLSISAVTYYVTPYEVISRLWAVPAAVVAVLFPTFAATKGNNLKDALRLYSMGGRAILSALAPIVLVLVVFANEGLRLWLGGDFPVNSAAVLQWLAIGVYVNSYAQLPFAFIQGIGHADITAKLHLMELPVYIAIMLWLLSLYGIVGVAVAWLLRVAIDAVLLTLVAHRLSKDVAVATKQISPVLVAPLFLFGIGMMLDATDSKLIFMAVAIATLGSLIFFFSITSEEKNILQKAARRFFPG